MRWRPVGILRGRGGIIKQSYFTTVVTKVVELTRLVQSELPVGEDVPALALVRFVGGVLYVADASNPDRMPADGIALRAASTGGTTDMLDEGIIENPAVRPPNPDAGEARRKEVHEVLKMTGVLNPSAVV